MGSILPSSTFAAFPPKLHTDHGSPSGCRQQLRDLTHLPFHHRGCAVRSMPTGAKTYAEVMPTASASRSRTGHSGGAGLPRTNHPPSPGSEPPYTAQIGDPDAWRVYRHHHGGRFPPQGYALGGRGRSAGAGLSSFMVPSTENRGVIIGGIANITLLPADSPPGRDRLRYRPRQHLARPLDRRASGAGFDRDGDWARGGQVNDGLLNAMLPANPISSAHRPSPPVPNISAGAGCSRLRATA